MDSNTDFPLPSVQVADAVNLPVAPGSAPAGSIPQVAARLRHAEPGLASGEDPAHQFETYPYRFIDVELDRAARTFWCWFKPRGRACFSLDLLHDLRTMQQLIRASHGAGTALTSFDYMVVGSKSRGAYNLGGDLKLFYDLVTRGDRAALHAYAKLCVDVVRDNAASYGKPIVTIALVEGSCLGGGFEAALSCDVIIAEEHVKFGFPEIVFGLFPGMGAVNFLSERIDKFQIDELLLSGKTYSAAEMLERGLVDAVVPTGEGKAAVLNYIQRRQVRASSHAAVCEALRCARRIDNDAFDRITNLWVEAALNLSERDLNKMIKLASAQSRKSLHVGGSDAMAE